jgi:transcriptional regulator with AAA-type ATPase domain/tetratricopeptide (TPR) repeat protein
MHLRTDARGDDDTSLELFGDRFVVRRSDWRDDRRRGTRVAVAHDLASNDEVTIVTLPVGGPSAQLRWSLRCGRFASLRHPCFARLVDFGVLGEQRAFEAWRCGALWKGLSGEAQRVRVIGDRFLRATDQTPMTDSELRAWQACAVLLPDAGAGLDQAAEARPRVDAVTSPGVLALSECGLESIPRPAVAAIAEVVADPGRQEPRAIALWGEAGSGLRVAVQDIARLARLAGMVPIDSTITDPVVWSLVGDRSVLVIDRLSRRGRDDSNGIADRPSGDGWRRLLDAEIRRARAHLLLITANGEVAGVTSLQLGPIADEVLIQAVRPHASTVVHAAALGKVVAQAGGAPARLAARLWRTCRPTPEVARAGPVRVAERPPEYAINGTAALRSIRPRAWPIASDVVRLRQQLSGALAAHDHGRRSNADRTARALAGALARRGDFGPAAAGLLALADACRRRGRPREVRRLLDEARDCAERAGDGVTLADIALCSGLAALDAGMLTDAEALVRTAVAAAEVGDDDDRRVATHTSLAWILFWQGRYDEAQLEVSRLERTGRSDAQVVQLAVAATAAAIGCGVAGCGLDSAARAVAAAERLGVPGWLARAWCASAFAHLTAGDYAAAIRDASRALRFAHRAGEALVALDARLITAEAERRDQRSGSAKRLLSRVARLDPGALPAPLRARVALLREQVEGVAEADAVERQVKTTGLRAIALFAAFPSRQRRDDRPSVDEVLELLGDAQSAADDVAVARAVCARLRRSIHAGAVALVVSEGTRLVVAASDGARVDLGVAERAITAEQTVRHRPSSAGLEVATPVRYGGRVTGALVARWSAGVSADAERAASRMTLGAAVVAPVLAGVSAALTPGVAARDDIAGTSRAIELVRQAAERAAPVPYPVLIEGESGSGKELVARAIHRRGSRRDRTFCAVNCAALTDDLLEAELFGHARGAFTGAVVERSGLFEEAHGGTLFLDEVGELSPRAQAKLLRTIQEGEVRRVGENVPRRVDVRLVAATNRNLRHEAANGRFRVDLLYRLDVVRIEVPPLRDRPEDIPLLVERFWREASERVNSRAALSGALIAACSRYTWPGNVRELQNVLAALAVRAPRRGVVPVEALPFPLASGPPPQMPTLNEARRDFEERFVRAALVRAGGHRGQTARELGVSRQGLTKLMARLQLDDGETIDASERARRAVDAPLGTAVAASVAGSAVDGLPAKGAKIEALP